MYVCLSVSIEMLTGAITIKQLLPTYIPNYLDQEEARYGELYIDQIAVYAQCLYAYNSMYVRQHLYLPTCLPTYLPTYL